MDYIDKIFNGGSTSSTLLRMFPDAYIQHNQRQTSLIPEDDIVHSLFSQEYVKLMKTAAHTEKFAGEEYSQVMYLSDYAMERMFGVKITKTLRRIQSLWRRL